MAVQRQLEVEVTNPVDYVKEQEGGGEEDPGVGIQLPDVDVDMPSSPAAFFTLLVAAEEAGAVFAVQTLIEAVLLIVVPEEGVAHWHHGSWGRSHGERWVGLQLVERRRISLGKCKPWNFFVSCCSKGIPVELMLPQLRQGAATKVIWLTRDAKDHNNTPQKQTGRAINNVKN